MNEATFLDAIIAEPDDLAHRLVFADWLEDQGDEPRRARAAFIRAQIERAALPAYHSRSRVLLREEVALLETHGAAWSATVAPLVRHCTFHRGFIEEVRVHPEPFLSHGRDLFRLAPIRRVQLRGTVGLPALLATPGNVGKLADLLGRVRVLDFSREFLGEAAGAALLALPRLPKLVGLHLAHNALTAAGIELLESSGVLDTLQTLEFTTTTSSADALQSLLHSRRLDRLTSLSLAGSRLGERAARMLTSSPLARQLRSLSLSHNNITPAALRELVESPAVSNLRTLDLGFNPLGAEGVRVLDRSPYLNKLSELRLSRTELGELGACALAAGQLVDRVESLDLSLNGIGDVGGLALAEYPAPARLQLLDLIYNPLGPDATARLAERYGEDVCLFRR